MVGYIKYIVYGNMSAFSMMKETTWKCILLKFLLLTTGELAMESLLGTVTQPQRSPHVTILVTHYINTGKQYTATANSMILVLEEAMSGAGASEGERCTCSGTAKMFCG